VPSLTGKALVRVVDNGGLWLRLGPSSMEAPPVEGSSREERR
jgi:hypothetical protein